MKFYIKIIIFFSFLVSCIAEGMEQSAHDEKQINSDILMEMVEGCRSNNSLDAVSFAKKLEKCPGWEAGVNSNLLNRLLEKNGKDGVQVFAINLGFQELEVGKKFAARLWRECYVSILSNIEKFGTSEMFPLYNCKWCSGNVVSFSDFKLRNLLKKEEAQRENELRGFMWEEASHQLFSPQALKSEKYKSSGGASIIYLTPAEKIKKTNELNTEFKKILDVYWPRDRNVMSIALRESYEGIVTKLLSVVTDEEGNIRTLEKVAANCLLPDVITHSDMLVKIVEKKLARYQKQEQKEANKLLRKAAREVYRDIFKQALCQKEEIQKMAVRLLNGHFREAILRAVKRTASDMKFFAFIDGEISLRVEKDSIEEALKKDDKEKALLEVLLFQWNDDYWNRDLITNELLENLMKHWPKEGSDYSLFTALKESGIWEDVAWVIPQKNKSPTTSN